MKRLALVLGTLVSLVACASMPPPPSTPTKWRATLVTAVGNNVPGEIRGVSDRFTFSSRVHAHATLVAEGPMAPVATTFSMKWLQGERLIHERTLTQLVTGSPYFLVHALPGSVFGVGTFRVELHYEGSRLATREFMVSER